MEIDPLDCSQSDNDADSDIQVLSQTENGLDNTFGGKNMQFVESLEEIQEFTTEPSFEEFTE